MVKKIVVFVLFSLLPLCAEAGKTYSSGSKSYTSGSSSYKTPSSPSQSYSTSSGKSYSSGSRATYSQTQSSSSKSYSTSSGSPYSGSKTSKSSYSAPSGHNYSSSSNSTSIGSKKVSSGGWLDSLSQSGREKDSKDAYEASRPKPIQPVPPPLPPKVSYKTPAGSTRDYYYGPSTDRLKNSVNYDRYKNYDQRNQTSFGRYANQPISIPNYNDSINMWFWLWLMDQNLDSKATWVYHHRSEIDDARYNDLLAKNQGLKEKIETLEKNAVAKDSGYVPPEIVDDPDLQYNKDYVEQVVRPIDWEFVDNFCFWSSLVFVGIVFVYLFFIRNY